ncbi:WapI family immunity protein [Leptospira licerasiae]|uniref:WapI family immunity protein n=1 Tax=Leptospira licerasiae TaxID=447106 RepID=UPI003B8A5E51
MPDLKKSYQSLSGIAKIETSYEDDVLKIKFKDNGHIDILCNVFIHDEYSQVVNIGFELDQSYLPSFIESLEKIYEELFP